jgi:signal transduction histidine kinase
MPYRPQGIKVRDIAGQVLAMFEANASAKEIKILNQVEASLEAYADENALQVILRNLVGNAIKFTPAGGQVSIGALVQNQQIQIQVNDSGTGIALEKQAHLFSLERKSEKGTNNEKGTGLGLLLVKEFAALNKGIVKVESQLNKGTTFSVSLPTSKPVLA